MFSDHFRDELLGQMFRATARGAKMYLDKLRRVALLAWRFPRR
jgi:hypothetical protein